MCVRQRINLGSGLHVSERSLSRLLSPVKTLEPLVPLTLFYPFSHSESRTREVFLLIPLIPLTAIKMFLSPDLGAH